jgi:hypothetical protein
VKALRNTSDESWATKDLPKLSKERLMMRYPAFSWKTDLFLGLLEGLASFIGYALMLAVNIFFLSSSCLCFVDRLVTFL